MVSQATTLPTASCLNPRKSIGFTPVKHVTKHKLPKNDAFEITQTQREEAHDIFIPEINFQYKICLYFHQQRLFIRTRSG